MSDCYIFTQIQLKYFHFETTDKIFLSVADTTCYTAKDKHKLSQTITVSGCQRATCVCCIRLHYLPWHKWALLSSNRWLVVSRYLRRLLHKKISDEPLAPLVTLQGQTEKWREGKQGSKGERGGREVDSLLWLRQKFCLALLHWVLCTYCRIMYIYLTEKDGKYANLKQNLFIYFTLFLSLSCMNSVFQCGLLRKSLLFHKMLQSDIFLNFM